jgi:predicted  nucleic acid-binding Zn-ribbon protein
MENFPLKPEQVRAPNHLSPSEIRKSLEELDSKIKVLQGRANATAADSHHTYHQHIAALEAKKQKLRERMVTTADDSVDTWKEIRNGLDLIWKDVMKYFEKKPEDTNTTGNSQK